MKKQASTIIVTGASRGVGRAIARKLADQGQKMLLIARNLDALNELCREINQESTLATALSADLASESGIKQAISAIEGDAEIFSGLIHAAGASSSHKAQNFEISEGLHLFTLNCVAFQAISATLLPAMRRAKDGNLLAIASVAGLRGYPYIASYAASKHALVGAVRSMAAELARDGVRVNALCPGYLDTDMTAATIAKIAKETGRTPEEARATLEAISPQNRLFTPEEVAESVSFLLSDASAGISGQAIPICGAELT